MKKNNLKNKMYYSLVKKTRSKLKINSSTLQTLDSIKTETPSGILFDYFHDCITKKDASKINTNFFPKSLEALYDINNILKMGTLANEIVWSISLCLLFNTELREFINFSKNIENYILDDKREKYQETLDVVESKFGQSMWLIENKLSLSQHWDGTDSKQQLITNLRSSEELSFLTECLIHFIGKRIEGTSIPGHLQGELSRILKHPDLKIVHEYVKAKVFDINNLSIEQIQAILFIEYKSSIIDLYESLISIFRWSVSNEDILNRLKPILSRPLGFLYKATKDTRLIPILLSYEIEIETEIAEANCIARENLIESYTKGEYEETVKQAEGYFNDSSNKKDINALILSLKAEIHTGFEINFNGILKEISNNFRKVLKLDSNSYAAALDLYSLDDRFKNHTWSTLLRLYVASELSVDNFINPTNFRRELYSRTSIISPFSLLLLTEKEKVTEQLNSIFKNRYPITKKIFEITINGDDCSKELIDKISHERYLRYMGDFHLKNDDYASSLTYFNEALKFTGYAESLKCHVAIVMCHMKSGNFLSALEHLTETYLKYSSTPTAMPFEEIIILLDDPDVWPDTICLPIIFALYTNYNNNDKLSHLRYAFESFNLSNNISTPSDLLLKKDLSIEHIKIYLKFVWRPEIMGQTIIYNGTREIEEARIQVCKALVEIDPTNSSEYQFEIRDLVKKSELAKATKLVDQSRVYVDVTAIKKRLKSRLVDVYSKYKNTLPTEGNSESEFIEILGDALGRMDTHNSSLTLLMSHFNALAKEDTQFSAMFSEITNEFLMGEHGLNTYLSTRVRHGKFSNAIRKPISDEYLVTEKTEGSEEYSPNIYWGERLAELNEIEKENVLKLLVTFGKRIDNIISYVRDQLIQVSIREDGINFQGNAHGLFEYRATSFERLYSQSKMKRHDNIDDFIDSCIDLLWEKTDRNLLIVKKVILGDIKFEILNTFDKLTESLGLLGYHQKMGELHNHIARARTSIQHQISNVSTWFKRSEVYDRPDYALDFPLLIAKNMVSSSISGADNWSGLKITNISFDKTMPGRTLDGMVDVYCASLENAIEHAGLSINDLELDASISYINDTFEITLINNIDESKYNKETQDKITIIESEIKKMDTRIKVQKEKGSGFHKIWSTINSPQYNSPELFFGFESNSKFKVSIKFIVESTDA
ncbi:hypothetical protein FHW11_003918 [Pantoea agglomerans]|uniref:hypothetical protein n=1 Tax=Enterobacter agglomerans TaxID=549 RepID=UPI0015FA5E93|nr:hypothetical protein [Pantoea agglomerans]MBA8866735.1 hypothetical protein [Pantoea agglomerans]MBA8893830.1 hypothetical protein [Pantoea agglomerans]